jgi:hypothetical protein
MMKKVFLVLFFIVLRMQQDIVSSELPPSQYIDNWKLQIAALSSISYTLTFSDYSSTNLSLKNNFESDFKIDFNNKRLLSRRENSEELITSDLMVNASKFQENNEVEYGVTSMIKIPKNYWEQALALSYMCYPFGYIRDQEKMLFLPEMIDAKKCVCQYQPNEVNLSCKTQQFDIKIKFIPEKNFAVKQIEIKRIVKNQDMPFKFQECQYTVNEFVLFGEIWFPTQYHVEEKYGSGKRNTKPIQGFDYYIPEETLPERTLISDVVLKNIKFPIAFSDKDFKITLPIPNGTPVYMQDALQIEHVWMDGKPVLKTDEVALAIARGGHKFIPGPQEPRFWLIALGIIMMLLGGGLKLRDMLKES